MTGPFSGLAGTAVAGFVDLQVNGGFGHDFTQRPKSIWEVAALLPRHGVTAFVPTVISSSLESILAALAVMGNGPPTGWKGARPLGLHVEGPMIAPQRRGTHAADSLLAPSLDLADHLIAAGPPLMVTLAPELPGAEAVVERLIGAGVVVAIGHSDATAAQAERSFTWGVEHATHLFNAMSGLDHRSPGVAAAVLGAEKITAGLIADGVHVDPALLRLAYRTAGSERIALVTDAMAATGLGEGEYAIGSVPVTVDGREARNPEGALAGSVITMDEALRRMMQATGCSLEEAVVMASSTPARVVGYQRHPGDLTLLDPELEVVATAIADEVVYRRPDR